MRRPRARAAAVQPGVGAGALLSAAAPAAVALLCVVPALAVQPGWTDEVQVGPVRFVSAREVRIGPGDPTAGDLYATVARARIDGVVQGDFVVAGSEVEVNGAVARDLDAAARTLEVRGTVGGRLRAAAASTRIGGEVGADALLFGWRVWFEPGSTVRGAIAVRGGQVRVAGTVGGPVWISAGRVTIEGRLEQGATIVCDRLEIGPGARIAGELLYHAREAVSVPAGAVEGPVTRLLRAPQTPDGAMRQLPPLFVADPHVRIGLALYFAAVALGAGILTSLFFRPLVDGALARTETGPDLAVAFGIGLVALLALLAVGVLCILALPLAIAVLCGLTALGYLGALVGKMVLGRWLLRPFVGRDAHPVLALLAGVPVVSALSLIPLLGAAMWFVVTITGMGAALLQIREGSRR